VTVTAAANSPEGLTLNEGAVISAYAGPSRYQPPERLAGMMALAGRAAAVAEPWLSHFDPGEIAQTLAEHGLTDQEDLGVDEIAHRYLGAPAAGVGAPGPHVIRARVII